MDQDKSEVRRLLDVLQTLMRMLAVSNREIERRMGLNHGTVGRVLGGQIEAKLEMVLGIARSIGLKYEEFFAFAYPDQRLREHESDAGRKIRSMLEDLRPLPGRLAAGPEAPGPLEREELLEDVKRVVRELMKESVAASTGVPRRTGNGG